MTTASAPATAAATEAWSRTSAYKSVTRSRPAAPRTLRARSGCRTATRTVAPSVARRRTSRRPRNPVPPNTLTVVMAFPPACWTRSNPAATNDSAYRTRSSLQCVATTWTRVRLISIKEHNRVLKLLRGMAVLRLTVAVLYGSEGRLDLPFVLAYVGIDTVLVLASVFTVDPSLQHERWRPAPGGADLLPMLLGRHALLSGPFGGGRAGCGPVPLVRPCTLARTDGRAGCERHLVGAGVVRHGRESLSSRRPSAFRQRGPSLDHGRPVPVRSPTQGGSSAGARSVRLPRWAARKGWWTRQPTGSPLPRVLRDA